MPKQKSTPKIAKGFRLSRNSLIKLKVLAEQLKTSQSNLIEALIEYVPPKNILQKLINSKR